MGATLICSGLKPHSFNITYNVISFTYGRTSAQSVMWDHFSQLDSRIRPAHILLGLLNGLQIFIMKPLSPCMLILHILNLCKIAMQTYELTIEAMILSSWISTFLACLMYTKCLQIPDTRTLILGIGRVLLSLPQNFWKGQLHMLVYCFQQEVPEQKVGKTQRSIKEAHYFSASEQALLCLYTRIVLFTTRPKEKRYLQYTLYAITCPTNMNRWLWLFIWSKNLPQDTFTVHNYTDSHWFQWTSSQASLYKIQKCQKVRASILLISL